ncbi:hypothetical protein PSTT_07316 [Puccinia striiformis]|uniref:HSF-type DNA-binding domain-containing protein n=1 Tax=Puccinia striiformis TaxID=27350 RepID=A0A2S4VH46_9BASI|nr:hypothetical protein PSTT_07316 [Puccinia striiformis]
MKNTNNQQINSRLSSSNSFSNRNKASLSISTQQQQQQQQQQYHFNSPSPPSQPPSPSSPSSPSSAYQNQNQNQHQHSSSLSSNHDSLSQPNNTQSAEQLNSQSSPDQNQPSSSSVGPNVAGRIGVGGNVMVDPYNPTPLSQKTSVGAGAFVYKVYNMLLDPSFQHLISFNPNGQSFTVSNVQDFSKTVLPKHFKHNNFSSFVRQLNMYGFHKVNKTPRGQRGNDNSAAWEFVHPKFHRGRPDLLEQIRRKTLDNESGSHSIRSKDPSSLISQSQASPTTQRFPIDAISFLSNAPRTHPGFNLAHPRNGPFFPHLPQRAKSDCPSELSPAAPGASFSVPDILETQLPSHSMFDSGSNPTIAPHTDHTLNEHQSSRQYTHSFSYSAYPIDPPSSSHSHISSAPITPLSAVPPPSSPMDINIDPKAFTQNPLEALSEIKSHLSGRFQGINASYEALYRELMRLVVDRVFWLIWSRKCIKPYKTHLIPMVSPSRYPLASPTQKVLTYVFHAVDYEFPTRELLWGLGAETTPVFKITEHNYPGHCPMVYDDVYSQQQQCPVSVGTSPSVSEFSHGPQTSPCDSAYRSLSVGPAGFTGFGNLTLASYPNSPVGGLMSDHQQAAGPNKTRSSSPPNTIIASSRSVSGCPSHHGQQTLGGSNNGLNSVPVSPRAALSTALKTPLPPSPAPFKHIGCSGGAPGSVEMIPKQQQQQQTDDYQQAFDSFIHHHHPTLSMIGAGGGLKTPAPLFPPPSSIDQSLLIIKPEECNSKPGTAGGRSRPFESLVIGGSSTDTLIFSTDNSPPPPSIIHPQHHHHQHHHQISHHAHHLLQPADENSATGRKRPASGSMDLSSSTLNPHHPHHHPVSHHLNPIPHHLNLNLRN